MKYPVEKDLFKGRDIWVIGTGHSIKDVDLGPLKNEITIGVNNLIERFTPNYLCISDGAVFIRTPHVLPMVNRSTFVMTDAVTAHLRADMPTAIPQLKPDRLVKMNTKTKIDEATQLDPEFKTVNHGLTVSIDLAIPLAIYLGARRILMLGQDATEGHRFSRKKPYWEGVKRLSPIEIINCTEGTAMTTFRKDEMKNYLGKTKIRIVQLHVVDHCNFNCDHCSHAAQVSGKKEYTWGDYREHVNTLLNYGRPGRWDVMGGEPFLGAGLRGIMEGLKTTGVPINIATNGYWIKNWKEHLDVIKLADHMDVTLHPQLKMGYEELVKRLEEVKSAAGIRGKVNAPGVFYRIDFTKRPIHRQSCSSVCPQLLATGKLVKCHIIAYSKHQPGLTTEFDQRAHKAVFDIRTGDAKSLETWWHGRGDTLHECCDYCRFPAKEGAVKH